MKKREEHESKLKEDLSANYSNEKGVDLVDDDNEEVENAYSQLIMDEAWALIDNDVLGPRGFLTNLY